jgi:hypothetical protein
MHIQIACAPADITTGIRPGVSVPPVQEALDVFLPVREGDGLGDREAKKSDVSVVQRLLNERDAVDPKLATDGKYGAKTVTAVEQAFDRTNGTQVGGQDYYRLQKWAFT